MIKPLSKLRIKENINRLAWKLISLLEDTSLDDGFHSSGEYKLVEDLLFFKKKNKAELLTAFDCGANKGEYSDMVLQLAGQLCHASLPSCL